MGFNVWRNMSALAFAGVALIGCNGGPQKAAAPTPTPTPMPVANQTPAGGFSTGQPQVFPTAKPLAPTSGSGTASQFGTSGGPVSQPPFMQQPSQVNTSQFAPPPGTGSPTAPSISPGTPPQFNSLQPLPPVNPALNPAQPNMVSPAGSTSGGPIFPAQPQPAATGGFAIQPGGPTMPGGSPGTVPMIPPPNNIK